MHYPHPHRRAVLLAAAAAAACLPAAAAVANTQVTWNAATSGSWSDATRWGGGTVPNNGTPGPASLYDAYLTQSGSPYTVTLASPVTISRLVHAAPATLNFAGGTLSLSDPAAAPNVSLLNSTTFTGNGAVVFDGPKAGAITFVGGQSGFLTLAPGITVRTGTQSGTMDRVVNQGTIAALTAGTSITLNNWSNTAGTLQAANGGALNLSGTFTRATLGSFSATSGGAVRVYAGTLNNAGGTLALSPATGSLTLAAGSTLSGGAVSSTGGVPLLVAGSGTGVGDPFNPGPGPATLSGVTVAADVSVAYGSTLTLSNNSLLQGQRTTLNGAFIRLVGAQAVDGGASTTDILFGPSLAGFQTVNSVVYNDAAATVITASAAVRTDAGSGVVGYTTNPLVNQGTISAQTPGQSITLKGSSVTNTGTISATNGGSIVLAGANWTNAGTISAGPGSAVTVTGTVAPAVLSTFNTAAGALVLATSLDLTSSPFTLTPTVGNLTLAPTATLKGGTLTGSPGAKLLIPTPPAGTTATPTLDGLTLAADTAVSPGATLTVKNNLTLANDAGVSLAGATLTGPISQAQTITGAGEVAFAAAATPSTVTAFGAPLTVGPGVTVRTDGGSGTLGSTTLPAYTLTLQGLVSAQTPGQSLTVAGGNWTNTGTLEAKNGSSLLLAGTFSTASLGTLSTSGGGAILVTGFLNNASANLSLSPAITLGISGGTITGGTIASPDGAPLLVRGPAWSTLRSVDVNAPVSVETGGLLYVDGSTLHYPLNLSAAAVQFEGAWSAPQPVAVTAGSTLRLGGTLPASLASFSATDSVVSFYSNVTTAQLDSLPRVRSRAVVAAGLNNTGATFAPTNVDSPITLSSSIKGGTLAIPVPGALTLSSGVTLDAVTLQSSLTLPDNYILYFNNGPTLSNVSLTLAANATPASLRFMGTAPLAGTGQIVFDGATPSSLLTYNTSSAVNIGPGITVRTGSQSGTIGAASGSGPVTVAGTISAQTPGKTLTVAVPLSSLTVAATAVLEARNGSTLAFPNAAAGSFGTPFGTWSVYDNSAISFPAGTTFTTNYANILLSGPNSSFPAIAALSGNLGSLTLINGRTFTTASSLTNAGTFTVGPSSTLKVVGTLTFAANSKLDLAGGSLIIDYATASPATTVRQSLLNGRLTSSTAAADPARPLAVAYAEARDLLRLTGSQTATWGGLTVDATSVLVTLTLPGDANLNGTIDPDDYALLDRSFAKSLSNVVWTGGDFNYDGVVTSADYLLIDTAYAQTHPLSPALLSQREQQFGPDYVSQLLTSVPEPSSLACLFATLPLLTRRRTKT